MPIKPAQYLDRYRNLSVPIPGQNVSLRVTRYRNNNRPATLGLRYRELKDAMFSFYQRHNPPDSGVAVNGQSSLSAPGWSPPINNFSFANFMHAFTGKISPDDLQTFVRLFAYWRSRPHDFPASFAPACQTLQNFADNYLGLDCSGFVGAYFRSQYAGSGVEPNSHIAHYREHWRARTAVGQIAEHDVLIWPGDAHIAVINTVNERTADAVTCTVSQAAADGAVQGILTLGPYRITFNGRTQKFRLHGPQNIELATVVRAPGLS